MKLKTNVRAAISIDAENWELFVKRIRDASLLYDPDVEKLSPLQALLEIAFERVMQEMNREVPRILLTATVRRVTERDARRRRHRNSYRERADARRDEGARPRSAHKPGRKSSAELAAIQRARIELRSDIEAAAIWLCENLESADPRMWTFIEAKERKLMNLNAALQNYAPDYNFTHAFPELWERLAKAREQNAQHVNQLYRDSYRERADARRDEGDARREQQE